MANEVTSLSRPWVEGLTDRGSPHISQVHSISMERVPLYRQSFGFSCGPAALMMVLNGIDPDIPMNLETELSIWRDAALMESKATSTFGLASAARNRGYRVKVQTDSDGIGFTSRLKKHFPLINVDLMDLVHDHTRKQALKNGVVWKKDQVTLEDIESEVDAGNFPIVLISSRMMREIVGIPHWVVVIGYDEKNFMINNPETARGERYGRKRFDRYLGFTGYRSMITIEKNGT